MSRTLPFLSILVVLNLAPAAQAQQNWTQVSPANSPSPRAWAAMAYDPVHQQTVLFGGCNHPASVCTTAAGAETWLWDGTNWTLASTTGPAPRRSHVMAWDPNRQQVVLYGGQDVGSSALFSDTWVWDGTNWTQLATTGAPTFSVPAYMAYDAAEYQMVLLIHGNYVYGTWVKPQTFVLDSFSNTWTQQTPTHPTYNLDGGGMAYDPLRQQLVMESTDMLVSGGPRVSNTYLLSSDFLNWNVQSPSHEPPPTWNSSYTWDGSGNQILRFGGTVLSGSGEYSDTWAWNGADWALLSPAAHPPARAGAAMAYDEKRRQVILFGGNYSTPSTGQLGDTWIFQNTPSDYWTLAASTGPNVSFGAGLAYDALHQKTVLFGGDPANPGYTQGDTWLWDGTVWTQQHPAVSPPTRYLAAMAYDSTRQQVVLFGGDHIDVSAGGVTYLNDTWTWDGTNWTPRSPGTSPAARVNAAMAFDELNQEMVLYGGNDANGILFTDTWVWNGTSWLQKSPAASPPGTESSYVLAYDSARQVVVANNGTTTWTWNGSGNGTWTQQAPTETPSLRSTVAIAFDAAHQRTVLFGGSGGGGGGYLSDTWSWTGTNWVQLAPVGTPPGRAKAMMAYDSARQQVVMFAGVGCAGFCYDTWLLGGTATATLTITVPAGVQFTFNGQAYTGTQTISVAPGSYSLSTTSPQAIAAGTQAVFASWSDGGTQSHNVNIGGSSVNITGTFKTQYLLTTSASPSIGGAVTQMSAVSNGPYYDAGTLVSVFESPTAGYVFTGWSGACSGTGACFVTMNAPATVTGGFTQPTYAVTINVPAGVQFNIGGFPFTGSTTIMLPAGTYSLGLTSPQAAGAGTQQTFVSWSDGGAQSHNLVVTAAALTVTGTFKTQYLLTTVVSPAGDGTISQAGGYYDAGTILNPGESANPGFQFMSWSGACTGSNPFCLVIMSAPMTLTANFAPPLKWVPVFPASSPTPRLNSTMAYDSARGVTVLFGGGDAVQSQFFNDTWEWNGTTWTAKAPATIPPAREYGALAYDPIHQQTILFGGLTANGVRLADTWVWDGTNWTSKSGGPSARSSARMVFDGTHNQILLFGGATSDSTMVGDTWSWNGASWTQLSPAVSPSARAGHGMVYDAAHQQVMLFGGTDGQGVTYLNDTWVWNGAWTKLSPLNPPAPRDHMAMAFDAVAQQVVLFAGLGGSFSNVTWFWDGANWTPQTYTICPIDRSYTAAAYDAGRQQLVLFGGYGNGLPNATITLNDTWIFSNNFNPPQYTLSISANPAAGGTVSQFAPGQPAPTYYAGTPVLVTATPNSGYALQSWSGACAGAGNCVATMNADSSVTANFRQAGTSKWVPVFPASVPGVRVGHMMAFDSTRGVTVLFGGANGGTTFSDTWEWDGTTWTQKTPATSPHARMWSAMAYDPIHRQTVLFGGYSSGSVFNDAWAWDGTNWTPLAGGPSGRLGAGMVFDAARSQMLLFGGATSHDAAAALGDTWSWNGSAWIKLSPALSPSARAYPGMAYDEIRRQVVLFGGGTGDETTAIYNDTWVWNGAWTKMSPATSPEPRDSMAIAFDGVLQQVAMFAGFGTNFSNITWFWDGSNWTQKSYTICPTDRTDLQAVYDSVRQQMVLFGGFGGGLLNSDTSLNDTWIFSDNLNPPQYTLSLGANPAAGGAVAQFAPGQPAPTYYAGTPVLVTATPNAGYELQSWSGACAGAGTCVATMNSNNSATANFGASRTWSALFPATSPTNVNGSYGTMVFDKARNQTVLIDAQSHTWTFDGTNWTLKTPPTNLTNLTLRQLVYDEANSVVVAAGGLTAFQTWTWDGTTWTQKFPATSPTVRDAFGMAYDAALRKVVLFGGENASGDLSDTWLWDGQAGTWTQIFPAHVPFQRAAPAIAYDAVRQVVVLFGGMTVTGNVVSSQFDTWLFNGSDWLKQSTPIYPAARNCSGMAWDDAHQEMILFGGTTLSLVQGSYLAETWAWDGFVWSKKSPLVSPPLRDCPAMTYDAQHQQPLLFGGYSTGIVPLTDTWVYGNAISSYTLATTANGNGTVSQSSPGQAGPTYVAGTKVVVTATPAAGYDFQYWSGACTGSAPTCTVVMTGNLTATANFGAPMRWVQLGPAISPQPTPGAGTETESIAYDAARQQIVFFGGPYGGGAVGNQTWVWNGGIWTQKSPATVPPARNSAVLAYDPVHQQVVMFGGYYLSAGRYTPFADTWVWDGNNWTQKAQGQPGPAARLNHGMAYDGQHIMLYGGFDGNAGGFSDTWIWDGNAWTQLFPANNPGIRSDFGMTYDAARRQVVLFSGFGGAGDTWLWDGTNWTQASPLNSPPGGWNVMAYDAALQQSILVTEPLAAGVASQTWAWDGTNWTQKNTSVTQRVAAAMTYDAARQQVILFGGGLGSALNDTWAFLAPSVNLVPQAPVAVNDGSGHYNVTVTLINLGTLPVTNISLTTGKVGSVAGTVLGPSALAGIPPGGSASFTIQVPVASVPGKSAAVTFQGLYSTATVNSAAWTASARSVNLP